MLLTGSAPRYMRAEVAGGRGEHWDVAEHALWWPPSKIAGRYLSPYLALTHEEIERLSRQAGEVTVDLELQLERLSSGGARKRAIVAPGPGGRVIAMPRKVRRG